MHISQSNSQFSKVSKIILLTFLASSPLPISAQNTTIERAVPTSTPSATTVNSNLKPLINTPTLNVETLKIHFAIPSVQETILRLKFLTCQNFREIKLLHLMER